MALNFNGSYVSRPTINLGGTTPNQHQSTQQDLINRAKQQREEREESRLKQRAVVTLQAWYRGRGEAYLTRAVLRSRFDSLLAPTTTPSAQSLIEATRLLALFFVDRNAQDLKRAAAWCRALLGKDADKTPLLFSLYRTAPESWPVLVRACARIILVQATSHPTLPQAPLFLEITKMLCDSANLVKWKIPTPRGTSVLNSLLAKGLHSRLRSLVLAIPPSNTSHPCLPPTISLFLLPLKAAPPPPAYSSAILFDFLTIPLISSRIPSSSVAAIAAIDFAAILLQSTTPEAAAKFVQLGSDDAVQLLAHLLTFVGTRSDTILANGKVLGAYLEVLATLLDKMPVGLFESRKSSSGETHSADLKGKGKEVEVMVIDDSDDEDVESTVNERAKDGQGDIIMGPPTATPAPVKTLDSRTLHSLSLVSSRAHLTSLLTLSTRYSTTRPSLAAFLVSLLQTLPKKRDEVLNIIMYGSTPGATERGGGLLREIWRGYVRAGPLGKLLASSGENVRSGSSLFQALADTKLAREWSTLVLLAELLSRALLTLGDDEFYSPQNPLSLDEVVGLSGLLRNLAFALYWQEGELGTGTAKLVVGTRMSVEKMRTLVTILLQQIHARDSRRSFTPEGHWIMTSQFDLASFIQTAVYEDEKLDVDEVEPTPRRRIRPADDDSDEEEEAEAQRRMPHHKPAHSKRQMAFISPRLGVLNNIPFVIPFEIRVAIFRQFIASDRKRLGIERHVYDRSRRHRAVIRRNHLSEDSYAHLNGLGAALKSTVEIVFIDEHGMEEQGIDGGGLFKELLTSLSKEAFDTDRGLWLATSAQELYPNPHYYARESTQLSWYTFIGRILGKALYEGILVDVRFATFFLSKWLGRQSYLDDLASLDPELYSGLMFLKNYTGNVETDLSLNFSVTEEDFGVSRTFDLIPGGSEIPVTNQNRMRYILLVSNYRLNVQIEKQCAAFFSGLSEIIPERFLRMFNQAELKILIGGVDQPIDVADLKSNTVYGGFPDEEANETIRSFWSVVESFDKEDRAKLVKFVTSCARPPLLGFKELNPRFAIRAAGTDEARLPTSSTCVNLLKLPQYKNQGVLKEKLLYALNAGAGFDLS